MSSARAEAPRLSVSIAIEGFQVPLTSPNTPCTSPTLTDRRRGCDPATRRPTTGLRGPMHRQPRSATMAMCARLLLVGHSIVLGATAIAPPAMGASAQRTSSPSSVSAGAFDHTDAVASSEVFAQMRAVAGREGRVRVIAGLRTSFTPEGALSATARRGQRRAVVDAAADVRGVLEGSEYRVVQTYSTVPYIALELSPQALQQLE